MRRPNTAAFPRRRAIPTLTAVAAWALSACSASSAGPPPAEHDASAAPAVVDASPTADARNNSDTEAPASSSGCDPAVFAEEIRNYIARAEDSKATASVDRERKRVSRKKKSAAAEPSVLIRPADATPVVEAPATGTATQAIEPVSGPQGSYWAWDPAAPAKEKEPDVAEPVEAEKTDPEKPLDGGYSSWANPWDVSASVVVSTAPARNDLAEASSTPAMVR